MLLPRYLTDRDLDSGISIDHCVMSNAFRVTEHAVPQPAPAAHLQDVRILFLSRTNSATKHFPSWLWRGARLSLPPRHVPQFADCILGTLYCNA